MLLSKRFVRTPPAMATILDGPKGLGEKLAFVSVVHRLRRPTGHETALSAFLHFVVLTFLFPVSARLYRLRENAMFLKGTAFRPCIFCFGFFAALAAEGCFFKRFATFPQLV